MSDQDYEDDPVPFRELAAPNMPPARLIRAWAQAKGLPIARRGRIPADVELAYLQARS